MNHIRIKSHYHIVAHSKNEVELRSGVWNPTSVNLTDEKEENILLDILCELNGQLSLSQIAKKLKLKRSELEGLIDHLRSLNVLEEGDSHALDYYLNEIIPAFLPLEQKRDKPPVLLVGQNALGEKVLELFAGDLALTNVAMLGNNSPLIEILNQSTQDIYDGLAFQKVIETFRPYAHHFFVFCQTLVNPLLLSCWNKIAYELKITWMHSALDGPFLFIGPTFFPGGPCFDCFEKRIMMNLREYHAYQKYKLAIAKQQVYQSQKAYSRLLTYTLASHVAMEIMNFYLTGKNFTQGKLLSIYLPTMEFSFNHILKVSHCETCSSHLLREGRNAHFDIETLLKESHVSAN